MSAVTTSADMVELDLSKHSKKLQTLIAGALDCGFTATQHRSTRIVTLHAPKTNKSIQIPPIRQMRESVFTSLVNQIRTHADQEKLEKQKAFAVAVTSKNVGQSVMSLPEPEAHQHLLTLGQQRMEAYETGENKVVLTSPKRPAPPPAVVLPKPRPAKPLSEEIAERAIEEITEMPLHVVKMVPRRARRRDTGPEGTQVYDSETTYERTWSNGDVDYVCMWENCDYSDVNHRSVSAHYAHSKTHTRVNSNPPVMIDLTLEPTGATRDMTQRRINKLADEIAAAVAAMPDDEQFSAEALARHIIEHRPKHEQPDEREPRTAEETLEMVRRLVDGGQYIQARDEVAELRAKVEQMEASMGEFGDRASQRIENLEKERDAALAAATKAKDTLKAFRELAAQEEEDD